MSKSRIARQVIVLGFISLFTDIASEMLYPVTPLFLTAALGASMAMVGIIEGIAEVTAGFLKGYFGNLSDKLKKRSIFVSIGYSLSAIAKPLPGLIPTLPAVVVSRVTDRVGKGIRTAPRDALLASHADGNSGAVFGFHRGMDTLGAAIGPVLALILLYFYPSRYALIYLIAFIPSLLAVATTFLVKDNFIAPGKKEKISYAAFWKSAPRQYKILLLLITLFSFANSSDVFLILKSKEVSHSETFAILGYIFYNLIYAGTSYPIGIISDKLGKRNVFVLGLLIFSAVYLGFGLTKSIYIIFILFAFYGIYASSTEGVTKAWVSDIIGDEFRGSAIGLVTMLSSFAVMIGSLLTGVLWDKFGSAVPFYFSGGLTLLICFSFFVFRKSNGQRAVRN
jgi:MFS family permease